MPDYIRRDRRVRAVIPGARPKVYDKRTGNASTVARPCVGSNESLSTGSLVARSQSAGSAGTTN